MGLAEAAVGAAGMSNSWLAVDEYGMIFFAPIETRVDDFMYQVADSDILLIRRADLTGLRSELLPNTSAEGERNKLSL